MNKTGDILPNFKLYYKAAAIKTVWCWQKKQTYYQWNQESRARNKATHIWSVNLQQGRQEHTMGKGNLFNKWWTVRCKRIKLDYFLIPHTKINSKWIKDLNVRPETIKLLEET